mmetsp:Transcript_6378/g.14423  ORF Transcript_6378/g.14423 Transcript_6378/m.14423 type:complete len:150 (-) Transcript_6378:2443-2892(-)
MAGRNKALSLYKSVLRAHEKFLPRDMRQLGDAYVKAEFRLHRKAEPEQATQFFTEWEKYRQHIERTGRENQSIDVGLVDQQQQVVPSSPMMATMGSSSNNDETSTNNNRGSLFGKHVAQNVVFNEEQEGQLGKLREEAVNAANAAGGKI